MSRPLALPAPLYVGGFDHSAEVLSTAIDRFGVQKPARVYYPGSSTDASLCGVEGLEVVHADIDMSDEAIATYKTLGATAVRANAHHYTPEGTFDAVVFINASGIDAHTVLDRTRLRNGGLVMSAMWGLQPPLELDEIPHLVRAAVGSPHGLTADIETDNLDDYFTKEKFEELDSDVQQDVYQQYLQFLSGYGESLPGTFEDFLRAMSDTTSSAYLTISAGLPYKKQASFYLFQNNQQYTF